MAAMELERDVERLSADDRLLLPIGGSYRFVSVRAVERILSAGDYSEVHLVDGTHLLVLRTLREWLRRLPSKQFIRVHRAAIVNVESIVRIEDWFHSSFRLHLKSGSEPLVTSRRCARLIRARFR